MPQIDAAGWAALAGAVEEVALPPSARYETLRRPADPRFGHVRPAAVVRCATPAGVAAAVASARGAGLPAVLRGGGHDFAGRSTTTGVVIDLAPMHAVTVAGDTARVGAGATLAQVYDALAAHGRTVPAGCGPGVGIAGLTLGGGLGVLGRRHGLTSDQLLAAEVVLADGRVVGCDARTHADLFWALRGGTGRFGAVTAFTFATVPAPALHSLRLTWPLRSAPALLRAWQAWAPTAPDDVAASLHLVVPADPAEPPHAAVVGTLAARPGQLDELIAAAGAAPRSDERRRATHRETKRILAGTDEGARGSYTFMKSGFVGRALPGDAVAALIRHLVDGRRPGQRRMLDLMPMGGAYNRVPAGATAFVHRAELFLLQHIVTVDPPSTSGPRGVAAALDWLGGSDRLAAPWRSGSVYQNFPDPDLPDAAAAYFGANLPRLRRIKARYDPDGFFGYL